MNPLFVGPLLDMGKSLIDRLFPDKIAQATQRAEAEQKLAELTQSGELEELQIKLSAIISDSKSSDPWTSRARPSFLYVVYILLLWSIPMGTLAMFRPDLATNFITGFKGWLGAIPDSITTLFGVVMTGYIGGRSWEKVKGVAK